jgi:hypothetical protein
MKNVAWAEEQKLAIPEPRDDFKPITGTTTIRIENATDLPLKGGIIIGGWKTADPTTILTMFIWFQWYGINNPFS